MKSSPEELTSQSKPVSWGDRIGVTLATVFGIGLAPIAPGTWGTAAAVPMVWAVSGLSLGLYLVFAVVVTGIAIWASAAADRVFGDHDSGRIVIDEVAGFAWTMVAVDRGDLWVLALGFLLFRVADITKPPPARAIDQRMGGGSGVVLDDVVAGLWAAAALAALVYGTGFPG